MDEKALDRLIDSLAESIKKFRKIIGEPTLGDDFISDVRKKSTFSRSAKDFLAESMCVTIKQWSNQYGITIPKNWHKCHLSGVRIWFIKKLSLILYSQKMA